MHKSQHFLILISRCSNLLQLSCHQRFKFSFLLNLFSIFYLSCFMYFQMLLLKKSLFLAHEFLINDLSYNQKSPNKIKQKMCTLVENSNWILLENWRDFHGDWLRINIEEKGFFRTTHNISMLWHLIGVLRFGAKI